MRIVTKSVEDFIINVQNCVLVDNTVWISKSSNHLGENPNNSVKFLVLLQASAVKIFSDGGECLVEMGIDCGYDYRDATQSYEGSEQADELKQSLLEFCEQQGFVVKPGILDM